MRFAVPMLIALLTLPAGAWAQASHPPVAARAPRGPTLVATLRWSRGPVEVLPAVGEDARPATAGEVLQRGARVRVAEGGAAELTFANGATVELGERTQVMMFASPTPPLPGQPPSTATTLLRGVMRAHPGASVNGRSVSVVPISTQAATVFIGRVEALIAAELGGHITRVSAHRGRVRVRAGTREYLVRAGSGTVEEFGRPPLPPHPLLTQPVWLRPPPVRVISGGEPVEVSATYGFRTAPAAPAAAAHWRVQVARDEAFHDMVSSVRVTGERTRWDSPRLQPGPYFARVTAIDAERYESPTSEAVRVFVAAPRVVTGDQAGDGGPGRVARVEVPEVFRCGLDGAPPISVDRPSPLVPGREHSLFCLSDAAGFDLRGITITAEQAGPLVRDLSLRGISYGESLLSLRLRDAEGHGVPYADVRVTADQGVTVDPLRESHERGVYTGEAHWPRGVARARFTFSINGAQRFEEELSQSD